MDQRGTVRRTDLCRIMGGEDRAQRHGPPL